MARRCIVGVMGGNGCDTQVFNDAREAGINIAKYDLILLTGAGSGDTGTHVKCAAMEGARKGRRIGIAPHGQRKLYLNGRELFLHTATTSIERDPITGTTADVLIFFCGGSGTLIELCFAAMTGKPLYFWKAAQFLKKRANSLLDADLNEALGACRRTLGAVTGIGDSTCAATLKKKLADTLAVAVDYSGTLDELLKNLSPMQCDFPTDFPGFRDTPQLKHDFESAVERLSR